MEEKVKGETQLKAVIDHPPCKADISQDLKCEINESDDSLLNGKRKCK